VQPAPARCWLVIGPEGGLTSVEEELLRAAGGQGISLGATMLRAETAAVALTAVCQACCRRGDG
ncbi:MAG: RsmE family RNA methyltransferase, partial [Candidatus Marinimicrobia bacterium]|nr:RsmE family RNA methyltransferase [Candidatus Neomarinimicrobiota bacterium]